MQNETCNNCGGIIGKLETAHIFDSSVVCGDCKAKLDKNSRPMMENLPRGYDGYDLPTQEELRIARGLGLAVSDEATRDQVRKLIDRKKGLERPMEHEGVLPTPKQVQFAASLGILDPSNYSKKQLSHEIDIALAQKASSPKVKEKVIDNRPVCQLCGGIMVKKTIGRSFLVGAFLGLSMILIGLLLCLTVIGALIGIPLIIIGLFYGSKRKKVLKCTKCGAVADRA